MIASLPPGAIVLLGALVLPLLRGRLQRLWLLALPVLGLVHMVGLLGLEPGNYLRIGVFDYQLVLMRVDRLSLVFGLIFHIVALLSVVYALHVKDNVQQVAGLIYAAAGIGAVFAGDFITLFVYWEMTAVASVFLVWASRSERSYRSGMRYLIIQVGSGVLLLAGILVRLSDTGSIAFDHVGLGSVGGTLIFLAFGIKCAFPLMHNWLQDAYPEATVTGTVFLSAFTTKLAVYTLARGFAGESILIGIGVTMTLFPIFFAVIENNLRRVLAYSLNNQLGFMVVGIGVGTPLALNGTCAHAFAHILYKALLFMSMGAVLYRTGKIKASELGGLYRSMPITAACCIVGAASISGFPLLSGFVSKSMVTSALAEAHMLWPWLGLLVASAGVMEHSGIKIPYFAFFGHDSGIRCKEAPVNMLVAMLATAALCIFIGVFPGPLYELLPYPVDYVPYTTAHVIEMLQLLLWAALAFAVLQVTGLYPAEVPSINTDVDWIYRRLIPRFAGAAGSRVLFVTHRLTHRIHREISRLGERVYHAAGPSGVFARTWPTGGTVLWVALFLAAFLIAYYVKRG